MQWGIFCDKIPENSEKTGKEWAYEGLHADCAGGSAGFAPGVSGSGGQLRLPGGELSYRCRRRLLPGDHHRHPPSGADPGGFELPHSRRGCQRDPQRLPGQNHLGRRPAVRGFVKGLRRRHRGYFLYPQLYGVRSGGRKQRGDSGAAAAPYVRFRPPGGHHGLFHYPAGGDSRQPRLHQRILSGQH